MSYCDHFGLRSAPFEDRADPQFTYLSPELEETLAAMEYESRFGQGAVLLLGDPGLGKTQLIRSLLLRLGGSDHVVVVTCADHGGDLIRDVSKGFGVSIASAQQSDERRLNRLRRHLQRAVRARHRNILILDQAERLDARQMNQAAAICDLQSEDGRLLSIIVAAQPSFRDVPRDSDGGRLRQQLFHERALKPLDPVQARAYVRHRLQVAGAANAGLIDGEAVALIHQASGGVPRVINHLCHAAMLSAFGGGELTVGRRAVAEVLDSRVGVARDMDAVAVLAGRAAALAGATGGMLASRHDRKPSESRTWSGGAEPFPGAREDLQGPPPIGSVSTWTESPLSSIESFAPPRDQGGEGVLACAPPGSLQRTLETLFDRGALLLERLEAGMSRAERVVQTTDGSLVQHAAVERHLESLALGGERISADLRETIRGGEDAMSRAAERATQLTRAIDARVERLDGMLARLVELDQSVESRSEALSGSLARASAAESRLAELDRAASERALRLDERASEIRKQVDACGDTANQCHTIIQRAERLIEELAAATDGEAADRLRRELQERIHDFESAVRTAVEDGRKAAMSVEQSIRTAAAEIERSVGDAVARVAATTQSEQRAFSERLKSQWESERRSIEEKHTAALTAARQRCDETAARIDELADDAAVVEERRDDLRRSVDAALEDAREIEQRVQIVEKSVRQAEIAVTELSHRAETITVPLRQAVDQGETLVQAVQRSRGETEIIQKSTSQCLSDMATAAERVGRLCQQVASCDVTVARLASQTSGAEALVERLKDAVEGGAKLSSDLLAHVAKASETEGRIGSHVAAATHAHHQLSAAALDAHRLTKQLQETASDARRVVETAGLESARREELDAKRAKAAEETAVLVARAKELSDGLQALVFEAGEQDAELRRVADGAGKVHRDLRETFSQTTALLTESRESVREAEGALRAVDERVQMSRDVLAAIESAEAGAALASTNAERAAADLQRSRVGAEEVIARIRETTQAAERGLATFQEQADQVRDIVARVDSLTEAVRLAREGDTAIRGTVTAVRAVHDDLLSTLSDVGRQCASLKELAATAQELLGEQERVRAAAQAAVRGWDDHVATTRATVESGASLLREFIEQSERIERRLGQMDGRAVELQRAVTDATDRPSAVLGEIREQNERLEKIFAAVRKVFAGLSQTALEARTRNDELRKTHDATVDRLGVLTMQTQKAAHTLRQWVEEAVRAQSRLEHTIGEAPTIAQTHPGSAFAELSETASSVGRWERSPGMNDLRRLPDPPAGGDSTEPTHGPAATTPVSAPTESVAARRGTPTGSREAFSEAAPEDDRAMEIARVVQQAKAARPSSRS